ncbi:MAG: CAP domain-containing protein [Thermoleophilaceae bacterium]|nr:CAP domain-containing protein [Thermoleophilaceae bacterium]
MAISALTASMPPAVADGPSATDLMVRKINDLRRAHGLRPLIVSRSLTRSASAFSRELMREDRFGHDARIEASGGFRRLGEVLAFHTGRAPAVALTLRAWASSPEHRAILLSSRFRSIGLGRTSGRFHGYRATIWVGQLGHR